MGKHWNETELDAFGHLNWTVGNEDWIACFDAILSPDRRSVRYHVVVDCESGSFVDTIESGEKPIDGAVRALSGMPDYWIGICYEHYMGEDTETEGSPYYISDESTKSCKEDWKRHLESLVDEARRLGPAEPDEEEEPFDPIRDGWVGKNGLP